MSIHLSACLWVVLVQIVVDGMRHLCLRLVCIIVGPSWSKSVVLDKVIRQGAIPEALVVKVRCASRSPQTRGGSWGPRGQSLVCETKSSDKGQFLEAHCGWMKSAAQDEVLWQGGMCWRRCRHCSGNYEAWGASGRKYEAQIAIFRILAAVDRFSWISWKVESHWGKLESRWGKQKAIEESRKPLTKVGKSLRKIGFRVRKIGFQARKILIFPERFSSFWQFWGLVLLQDLLPRVHTDLLCWTQVLTTKIKLS